MKNKIITKDKLKLERVTYFLAGIATCEWVTILVVIILGIRFII